MPDYKLLTPGPLTTTRTVMEKMLFDHCTWDEDYKKITMDIRKKLLSLAHAAEPEYTVVLMQGSGTFGVESVLTSVIGEGETLLIASNGSYGRRMCEIAEHTGISCLLYEEDYDTCPSAEKIRKLLQEHPEITHVSMVHSETTSGILNDIASVAEVVKDAGKTFIVDAMSSFGGVDIPVCDLGIDFLVSSANKCIQGVPGFSFIICRTQKLEESQGKARSLSLDLYDQWVTMKQDGKWRFTSPTHVVLAFWQALKELGFEPYISEELQGPIITTLFYPEDCHFTFQEMYEYIKERGYAIYPGKVTDADTFRIGNIGEIYPQDIENVYEILKAFLEEKRV